jgi:SLT domain-containing protein
MSQTVDSTLNATQQSQLDNFTARMDNAIAFNLALESVKIEKGTQLGASKAQTNPV